VDAEGEKRTQGWQRAGDETDAFFGKGPEADLSGGVDKLTGVGVESEVFEADNGCAGCTRRKLVKWYTN
jgi:hypothetical protein